MQSEQPEQPEPPAPLRPRLLTETDPDPGAQALYDAAAAAFWGAPTPPPPVRAGYDSRALEMGAAPLDAPHAPPAKPILLVGDQMSPQLIKAALQVGDQQAGLPPAPPKPQLFPLNRRQRRARAAKRRRAR